MVPNPKNHWSQTPVKPCVGRFVRDLGPFPLCVVLLVRANRSHTSDRGLGPPAIRPVFGTSSGVDVRPGDVMPVDMRPADVRPVDVRPADVRPADVRPVDVRPADVRPVDVRPVDVRPEDVRPVDVR